MLSLRPTDRLAIDLGNTNTLLTDQYNVLCSQPSCIVVDTTTDRVRAVGEKALQMFEKTPAGLKPVKPLNGGVIADGEWTKKMLNEMVRQVRPPRLLGRGLSFLLSGIPYDTTEVEKRALRDALDQFRARATHLVYEPLAAALGMGLDIREPEGKMVVDIGGGITEIVIISLSGIAASRSLKVAGDTFDIEIRDYLRREYNMAVGMKTAEAIKIRLATAVRPKGTGEVMEIKGKHLVQGIPVSKKVCEAEIFDVLNKPLSAIEAAILQTLERCPPELSADIYQSGMHVTGGNALIRGLGERLMKTFSIPVNIDDNALQSVTHGVARILTAPEKYKALLLS